MFDERVFMDRRICNLLGIGVIAIGLAACNNTNDDTAVGISLPQVTASDRLTPIGNCADLITRLSGLANTEITASTEIAAGTLTVGGAPIATHCLVTGKMRERISTVDNNTYAIGFEMRLPLEWNGRFLSMLCQLVQAHAMEPASVQHRRPL